MKVIEKIFGEGLEGQETRNIEFRPAKHHKKAVGLLFSADCSASLVFGQGTDLKINQFEFAYNTVAHIRTPDERIFNLDQDLNCELITGTVTNLKPEGSKAKNVNVYLIIEHEH